MTAAKVRPECAAFALVVAHGRPPAKAGQLSLGMPGYDATDVHQPPPLRSRISNDAQAERGDPLATQCQPRFPRTH
ncbi:MAG: hypothetical protein JWR37_3530 [Mycobacterium sp.]|nr:hypothetical protein [Mycobacterium sp.]